MGAVYTQLTAKQRVCQETIYRYIYSKEGTKDELWWYLPTQQCRAEHASAIHQKFHRDGSIMFRPDDVTSTGAQIIPSKCLNRGTSRGA